MLSQCCCLLEKNLCCHCKKFSWVLGAIVVEQSLLTTLNLALQLRIGLAEYLFPALWVVLRVARCGRRGALSDAIFLVQLVGKLMQHNVTAIIDHCCAIQRVLPRQDHLPLRP